MKNLIIAVVAIIVALAMILTTILIGWYLFADAGRNLIKVCPGKVHTKTIVTREICSINILSNSMGNVKIEMKGSRVVWLRGEPSDRIKSRRFDSRHHRL